MQLFIGFFVVGLLEKLISADITFFELLKFFLYQRCDIDIDATDILPVPAGIVNGFYTVVNGLR